MTTSSKDPAFLMYSKDWLEGTADISQAAKGVYIDLLCYQHQRGNLPNNPEKLARLSRIPVDEFNHIWEEISCKFELMDNHLVNHKLCQVQEDRKLMAKRKRISGIFGTLIRQSDMKKKDKEEAKKAFKTDDFMNTETERLTECITTWLTKWLQFDEDANENVITVNNSREDIVKNNIEQYRKWQSDSSSDVYKSFVDWLIDRNPKFCLSLADQITETKFSDLLKMQGATKEKLKTKIMAIEGWTDNRKYKHFYAVLKNWMS